jgi:hypothetical protein
MGMLVAMIASHVILGMKISLPTLLGYATVCTGSALYYLGVKELMGAEVSLLQYASHGVLVGFHYAYAHHFMSG